MREDTKRVEPKRKRIIALDLIRGYFLIAIIVDHVFFAPSLFFLATGGGLLFASPAEGFFVISGILVGYLYGPKILTQTRAVCRKVWKRAGLLYVLSVTLTMLFTVWAHLLPAAQVPLEPWNGDVAKLIFNTLTLRYAYGWTDFLPRYALFMLAAPAMLWFVAKGKWWLLAAASILMWAVFRGNAYLMPFSAWQLLFVGGVIIGYYLPQVESWFKERSVLAKRMIAVPVLGLAAITFTASIIGLVIPHFTGAQIMIPEQISGFFDKNTLGIGRLVLGMVWFSALYLLVRRYERQIEKKTKGVLQVFGTKSLLTYCLHGVVLFAISTVIYPVQGNVFVNTLATTFILVMMYVLVASNYRIKRSKGTILPIRLQYEANS